MNLSKVNKPTHSLSGPVKSFGCELQPSLTTFILTFVLLAMGLTKRAFIVPAIACAAASLAMILHGSFGAVKSDVRLVELPSVSRNLDLRTELTYAATVILNDTSAHYLTVADDLTLKGQVIKEYRKSADGRIFDFKIDSDYRSARGDILDVDDIHHSIKFYLQSKPTLAGPFKSIVGAKECSNLECDLKGFEQISATEFRLTLSSPDQRFVEKLASPWLLILKANRPALEEIGDCTVPYQTGPGLILECDRSGVLAKVNGEVVRIVDSKNLALKTEASRLLTENPGSHISPTLTVLSAFALPDSRLLTPEQRVNVMTSIRRESKELAQSLKLNWSPLLTPRWLAIESTKDIVEFSTTHERLKCPEREIRIVLDTSFPNLDSIRKHLSKAVGCKVEFRVTEADNFFSAFEGADIALVWWTPDYLDIYNVFVPFDCTNGNGCTFNWRDKSLERQIDDLRALSQSGVENRSQALSIERLLMRKGYVAPIAEMNWWIQTPTETRPVHAAGLFQVRIGDFL